MGFMADIPHFYCLVRNEYLYDLQKGHGEFTSCLVFGVDSVEGHAIGFDILTEWGGMFARLPITSLVWKVDAPEMQLESLELWNNFSYSVEAHEYRALRQLRTSFWSLNGRWYDGEYMFTLSWLGSSYAEQPGEGGFKRAHILKLDNGCFAAQPNNRVRWYEPSFITKPFPDHPDFRTNSHVWNAERRYVTEDSDRYFYSTERDISAEIDSNPEALRRIYERLRTEEDRASLRAKTRDPSEPPRSE